MLQFECFLEIQDILDQQLIDFQLTSVEYYKLWNDILKSFGYTQKDYEHFIDERWFVKNSDKKVNHFHC
jgi:hypothetical protein